MPFFQMAHELSVTGKETARVLYGAKGWVAHHNTDIWRAAGPVDFADAGMWLMEELGGSTSLAALFIFG